MPCFKGLAVSIHAGDGPLPEYGMQKQSRMSRISSYIPVPPAKIPEGSLTGKPEQSTFAVSITLLVPNMQVPYSAIATPDDPFPQPRHVGGALPSWGEERGSYTPSVQPYIPRTNNPNETIAAYIYFDGRAKEEVATLLRRGEETWVNSRWVSVPESEGGGLAEREFLFREVGLERWLNGLDLDSSKVNKAERAERVERRQKRLEKKRRKKSEALAADGDDALRYGADGIHDGSFSSDSDSDDDPPEPEAAGQIKVALFRVLASGEIKRGEYSPQFDAHDDDDEAGEDGGANGNSGDGDIDHTTSFAKPKTLDPKSISTQTVTGLDPPESPYAVFTFFYRGEKQLRKMSILPSLEPEATPAAARRKSRGTDFSNLGPLKTTGTKGFSGYRDTTAKRKSSNRDGDAMDSDADDEDDERGANGVDEAEEKVDANNLLSPDDAKRQGEIADGVRDMKLKRQHSVEPLSDPSAMRKSPHLDNRDSPAGEGSVSNASASAVAGTPPDAGSPAPNDDSGVIGSPYKRHRASLAGGLDSSLFSSRLEKSPGLASVSNVGPLPSSTFNPELKPEARLDMDEEL